MRVPFWIVNILDALLSILVLAPLVVAYWRGTFLLLEIYLLPGSDLRLLSIGVSLVIAFVGGVLAIYVQDILRDYVHNTQSPVTELMLKRVYCYIFGLIVVNHWRGIWALWDDYTGMDANSGLYCFTISISVLLLSRSFRNSISPPVVAAADLSDGFFAIKTRFRVPRHKRCLFFLDALFGVVVFGSMIVGVCRGFWYMLDTAFVFEFKPYSYILSFGLGFFLVFASLVLQRPAAAVSRRLEKIHVILKIIFEDVYMMLATASGTNIWRGVWGLANIYVFPSDEVLSSWTCHIVGMGGLMLMFHGSSALIKGFEIDGEYTDGEGCFLPASSLTIFQDNMGQTHRRQVIVGGVEVQPRPPTAEEESLMKGDSAVVQMEPVSIPQWDSSVKNTIARENGTNHDLTPWEEKYQHGRRRSSHPG